MDGTDSLLDLVDQLRKKAEEAKKSDDSIFKKRALQRSEDLAVLAASAFAEGVLDKALDWLTQAINAFPSATLYAKRSVVHMALQHNVLAAADAVCAVGMDPSYASGYLCAALSRIRLGDYEEGLKSLEKLRRCFPNSKKINDIYVRCRDSYWETGKIQPFDPPTSISKDLVHEEYSVFKEDKLNDLRVELSSSGVLEASKLTEDFVRRVIETYKRGVFHLPQKYVFMILKNALDVLQDHSNIVSIDISSKQTLTVVGDLRGKFNNLLSIFRHNRTPHFGRPYLFNGNVIGSDRMSLPVMITVLCLKILFPEDVFINRGSEECLEMCELNGFEHEVLTVYDEDMMKAFTEVFNWLPAAHILNNNVLIIHGGLFEDEKFTLADLQGLKRCFQPPDSGPMCDILHSDPWNYKGTSKKGRRRGIWFGPDVTERFCHQNCIDYIVRSHQDVGEYGYEVQTYRQCVTIDSSTNYATYLVIRGKTSSFKSVHARKDKVLPKHCKCFLTCSCRALEEPKLSDPLHDGYVTTNMTLPSVPAILNETSKDSQETSIKSLTKSDQLSLQRSAPSLNAISKSILVTSKKLASKSSELKVNFGTASKSSLEQSESAWKLQKQSTATEDEVLLSESVKIVSANYPAPDVSSMLNSSSSRTSKVMDSRPSSNTEAIVDLGRATSSAEVSTVALEHTTSQATIDNVANAAAEVTSEAINAQVEPEDVTNTLFVSSKETAQSNPLGVTIDKSPGNSQTMIPASNSQVDPSTADRQETRASQMVEGTTTEINYLANKVETEPSVDDEPSTNVELVDEPNARTNEMYSELAAASEE